MKFYSIVIAVILGAFTSNLVANANETQPTLLVEAESFEQHGGWSLDTQFIREMGSPYLIAHGLGKPVNDATANVTFPETGKYEVFVRTKDWVARWNAPGTPGQFQLLVNGKPLSETFGTKGANWDWQSGGVIDVTDRKAQLALRDLTGFDGRCDAIVFRKVLDGKTSEPPPNSSEVLPDWRRSLLGLSAEPTLKDGYDLVVVGGGYAGMGAALSAARMGCKVALIQDRPVLGGNGSSEVRVWAMGLIRRGKYPRIGEIIEEFSDKAKKSPGTFEEFGDEKKEALVRAEPNIDLFLYHHAFKVDMNQQKIAAVYAFDTRTSEHKKFVGKLFCDATGHATIGALAGADSDMAEKGRMGMSNMWAWDEGEQSVAFPKTPWALDLTMADFPYPVDHHGQWFWESGFDKDPLNDAEGIRDWNLRAVFGAFNAMKNRDGADKHGTAFLTWVAYIGGPRESRQLLGDVILTQDDIVAKREFPDGCVPSTWSIDLHYPKKQFAKKFEDNPFISIAEHDRRIDRDFGYPVPYRCFYSRNIENLFMAGRCVSVTHQALGTVRVMKTCGMMGEVVGKAASICIGNNCPPSAVYDRYWPEMDKLLQLPGKAHRSKLSDTFTIPADSLSLAGPLGLPPGVDPASLPGVVIDNRQATRTGEWVSGTGLKGYVGYDYVYASPKSNSTIAFQYAPDRDMKVEIRLAYQPHENRASNTPVSISASGIKKQVTVDMRKTPTLADTFVSLGTFEIAKDQTIVVQLATEGTNGNVHADAVQFLPVE
ncbi:MAG: FAD-dependent oxidoreductase [Planctomycetota bacterium]|nr:FAD-dependent oxidoreductase [Planctomycetota bacterium]